MCGNMKTPEDFRKDKHRRDGLATFCRVCAGAAEKEWRCGPVLDPTVERKACQEHMHESRATVANQTFSDL